MIAIADAVSTGPLVADLTRRTKISIVVTDEGDCIVYEHVMPTDPSALVGQIVALVEDARRELRQDFAAVGVAVPGQVDPDDRFGEPGRQSGHHRPAARTAAARQSSASRSSSSTTPARRRSG